MTKDMIAALREQVRPHLEERRYLHTLGVEKEIRFLAAHYMPEAEEELAAAALLHDITKKMPLAEQMALCEVAELPLTEEDRAAPQLLHAKSALPFIRTHFPTFATPRVLQAVLRHTTAALDMEMADILLYLADMTEEGRSYAGCIALREALHSGLTDASRDKETLLLEVLLRAYDQTLTSLIASGRTVSVATVAARNQLLAILKTKHA